MAGRKHPGRLDELGPKLQIRIATEDYELLKEVTARRGCTLAAFGREAVRLYLQVEREKLERFDREARGNK